MPHGMAESTQFFFRTLGGGPILASQVSVERLEKSIDLPMCFQTLGQVPPDKSGYLVGGRPCILHMKCQTKFRHDFAISQCVPAKAAASGRSKTRTSILDGARETLVLLRVIILQGDLELDRLGELALFVLRVLKHRPDRLPQQFSVDLAATRKELFSRHCTFLDEIVQRKTANISQFSFSHRFDKGQNKAVHAGVR